MFPTHFLMLFPVLQFTQRKRVMIIKIDMKALSSYECIIMTPITNWLFEKHKIVLLEYFDVHSLIYFKARAQFWFTDTFPWILRRGKFEMGDFCDSHRSIADRVVKMCHCKNSSSHLSQIAFIAASQIVASQIALSHSIIVCCLRDVAIYDVAYRTSEIY